jgi:hypothetical protein
MAEDLEIVVKAIDKPFGRIGVRLLDANGHKDHWIYQGKPLVVEGVLTIQVAELQWDRVQLRLEAPKELRLVRKELLAARY